MSRRIEGLDGLRGVAVLLVVAFHLWPRHVPGGFLGVDVFFVLSGFLITTLLLRERTEDGHVDLPAFWRRRARRLLPALVLVVTTTTAAALVISRDLLVGIGRQVLGALTFSSNWLEIGAGSDYFDRSSALLFQTFWSLAVEEQFYLAWPVAFGVICALGRTPRHRAAAAVLLALASAVLMATLHDPGASSTRAYYGTDSHLFGLMLGAALGFATADASGRRGLLFDDSAFRRWRPWVGFVATGALGALALNLDSNHPATYRGGILLASMLALVIVAVLPGSPTAFQRLHQLRPLVWVGKRSYGIYLWHWPVILLVATAAPPAAPGAGHSGAVVTMSVTLTFGLAAASYRWVEEPVRRHGFGVVPETIRGALQVRPAGRLALSAAGMVVVLAVGAVATAPDRSAAERAVERGQRAIAAHAEPSEADQTPVLASDAAERTAVMAAAVGRPAAMVPVRATSSVPSWPEDVPQPPGDQIIGFGDSVLSGAAPALYERFPGVHLDAEPIRQWRDAPALVADAIESGTIRPVVVLSFGTNAGLESDESVRALETVLDRLGPRRRVVLVNTVGVSGWVRSTNATLAEIVDGRSNAIVADWHSMVVRDPGLLHDDRTHPNLRGIRVYAELLASALERLGPS